MLKRRSIVLLLALCMALPAFSGRGIPERIGPWRVEVGPPGNEFYEVPAQKLPPPSEAVLRWAKIIAPQAKVTQWEVENGGYRLHAEVGTEQYQFDVAPDGTLLELQYENDAAGVQEEPGGLILRGAKKNMGVSEMPRAVVETLARAVPGSKPSRTWMAETIVGLRYVIVIDQTAFYARPDGQIQAAGLISKGALDEIDAPSPQEKTRTGRELEAFDAELAELLGPYRERFNFENQIKGLGKRPRSADGSFRYVVIGDSRSQWELWSNIVKHIDSLDPKPDFVINSGDIVPTGYAKEYRQYYIPPLSETDIPCFVAIGNHDDSSDSMAREYRYLFGERALNYYFDYGKTRYIFVDNVTKVQPYEETLSWLEQTLANTPKGYRKYVCAHKPPSTIEKWAYHAWDGTNSRVFTDLMTKHKVDEVYLGHIHAYSTARYGGVDYTLSGGGGAGLHDRYGPLGNVHHYVICDVAPDGTVKQQVVRFYRKSE